MNDEIKLPPLPDPCLQVLSTGQVRYTESQMNNRYRLGYLDGLKAGLAARPVADAGDAVAEWVNQEQGFQLLVRETLLDGTLLYRAAPSARTLSDPAAQWAEADRIANLPTVDEALQGFSDDPTSENGICVVAAVLAATSAPAEAPSVRLPKLSEELREFYPSMSAENHEEQVKKYARDAVRRALKGKK